MIDWWQHRCPETKAKILNIRKEKKRMNWKSNKIINAQQRIDKEMDA